MKYPMADAVCCTPLSRPVRALWIEILLTGFIFFSCLKYYNKNVREVKDASRPVRALWIEMDYRPATIVGNGVEAREGLVD